MNSFVNAKRVVIKVGTSTLTYETGLVNIRRMEKMVKVLSDLANSGRQIIFVTSGAIGVGAGKLGLRERPNDTPGRQAAAAVGQSELMHLYDNQFLIYNHVVAQVLLTKDVVDDAFRRRNVVNTFNRLLSLGAIPIINENDTVAVDELEGDKFGDNDTLSAIVAELVDADALVIMSDIEGLFDSNPRANSDAKLIPVVTHIDDYIESIASGTGSNRGTGGMTTKISAARIAEAAGIDMAIVSGENPENLYRLFDGDAVGTAFLFNRSHT
ncbi:MAG: glutamate 5-kinase [Oscillospiraceae bacterium]|jgi:glutamate 5-kinase|nr:glutamate 5-kinase [Oscillospiraceae bacterium]